MTERMPLILQTGDKCVNLISLMLSSTDALATLSSEHCRLYEPQPTAAMQSHPYE